MENPSQEPISGTLFCLYLWDIFSFYFFFLSVKKNTDNWLYDCWDIFNYIFPFWLQGDGICSSESKGM